MTSGAYRRWLGAPIVLLLIAGCTTANIEDIAPASQVVTPADAPLPEQRNVVGEPGAAPSALQADYPNLNVPQQGAAPQFTDAQREAEAAALAARRDRLDGVSVRDQSAGLRRIAQDRARQAATGGVADQSDELRRLARTHGDRAIEEIEGQ